MKRNVSDILLFARSRSFLVVQLPKANIKNCTILICLEHLNYNWKGKDKCFGICLSKTLLPKGIDQVGYPEARLKATKKIPKYPGSRNKRPTGQNINPPDKENEGYYVDYEKSKEEEGELNDDYDYDKKKRKKGRKGEGEGEKGGGDVNQEDGGGYGDGYKYGDGYEYGDGYYY